MDQTLAYVGECGTYQNLVLYLVLLPCVLPCGFHAYAQLFMSSTPKHFCRPPDALAHLHPVVASNLR
ncbi:hypothetical protein GE061_002973 [Apolygus lucorum]|uniref:Uncharacterized protein n=1 Tax=Apolygus lucorum TaxID=248454 RepID=A0A6A4IV09_APOLU|nr:hypothetical protein GE061_002973 [Apolygus lucorum]